ncbi:MAG: hypothetical protein ACRD1J_05535, partial [Terriglobia bacterium]
MNVISCALQRLRGMARQGFVAQRSQSNAAVFGWRTGTGRRAVNAAVFSWRTGESRAAVLAGSAAVPAANALNGPARRRRYGQKKSRRVSRNSALPVAVIPAPAGIHLLLSVVFMFVFVSAAYSQIEQVEPGFPAFSSFSGGAFDTVDNTNLNVHFAIPVLSKAGRGLPFDHAITYDSSLWTPVNSNGTHVWSFVTGWGWGGDTAGFAGYVTYVWSQGKCWKNYHWNYYSIYSDWAYFDPSGTRHSY